MSYSKVEKDSPDYLKHRTVDARHQYLALEMADVGSWQLDLSTLKAQRSLKHDQIFGYNEPLPEWSFEILLEHVHPGDREYVKQSLQKTIEEGVPWDFECRIFRKDNEPRWIWAKGNAHRKNNTPTHLFGIVSDITERKLNEEMLKTSMKEKEVLLSEVHHRVKNNLAIVSSMLSLQSSQTEDQNIKALLDKSISRVKSISLIHEKLYQEEEFSRIDFGKYAEELAAIVINTYCVEKSAKIDYEINADKFYLDISRAVPCGLIINELVTNACRHAFDKQTNGKILITLKRMDGYNIINVSDNGSGLPDNVKKGDMSTLGLTIINGLAGQLRADLTILSEEGTSVTVTFPEVS